MSQPRIIRHSIWCPTCNEYVQLLTVPDAAKLGSVDRRTIYRYIEQGLVYSVRIAGKRYRVCGNCLFRQEQLE